jgi:hypothetical protein
MRIDLKEARTMRVPILALALAFATAVGAEQPTALKPPAEPPQRPLGFPALKVHAGGVILDVKEVGDYVKKHNLPRNQGPADEIDVLSVERIAVKTARAKVGIDTTGFKGNELVGLAILGGKLVFGGPPPSEPVTFYHGYVVFDAATGNLLMLGTLAE